MEQINYLFALSILDICMCLIIVIGCIYQDFVYSIMNIFDLSVLNLIILFFAFNALNAYHSFIIVNQMPDALSILLIIVPVLKNYGLTYSFYLLYLLLMSVLSQIIYHSTLLSICSLF